VAEIGGAAASFRYLIKLRKYTKPPEPPQTSLLDAGIFGDALGLVDALNALDALADLGSIPDLQDPTPPLRGALDNVKSALNGLGGVTASLNELFGGGG
jgi:hypothetical protein